MTDDSDKTPTLIWEKNSLINRVWRRIHTERSRSLASALTWIFIRYFRRTHLDYAAAGSNRRLVSCCREHRESLHSDWLVFPIGLTSIWRQVQMAVGETAIFCRDLDSFAGRLCLNYKDFYSSCLRRKSWRYFSRVSSTFYLFAKVLLQKIRMYSS